MKKPFVSVLTLLFLSNLFAQVPEKMSYQAVIRDNNNQLINSQLIGMRISILQGSSGGGEVYTEIQTPMTNANGLISVEIGGGSGYNSIDWSKGPYLIKTEIDPSGGTNYTITGTSQLLTVPYALHAKTADQVSGMSETDPVYSASKAAEIDENDIMNLNNLSGVNTGDQGLDDVLSLNNSADNNQIKNLRNPTHAQDAATKSYVTLHVSETGDTLFLGTYQWVIIPGISAANEGTKDIILDGDGNKYSSVIIGAQEWLAKNLHTTKYYDETSIPLVTNNHDWKNLTTPAYCWYNNYKGGYGDTYGALYNGFAVETGMLCPAGWHVPTDDEWKQLEMYLGMSMHEADGNNFRGTNEGDKLKTTYGWEVHGNGTNESGFSGLPGGHRDTISIFRLVGYDGYWWTSTQADEDMYLRVLVWYSSKVLRAFDDKRWGFSVRCIRD